ncbi:MAG: adenylate kinase [Clostridiales bacterium]|nr:adenylate kinase [Clostridiales bacterium]
MNLVFLGPPGAGKGTQAARVSGHYGIAHISTGDMFRKAMNQGSSLGVKAKSYIDRGLLVPDAVVVEMVAERLKEPDCASGYLLDGFPRTEPQAIELDRIATIDAAVEIAVDADRLIARLAGRRVCPGCGATVHVRDLAQGQAACPVCGEPLARRADDQPEVIAKRLKVYAAQTETLIAYYERRGKLVRVDGDQPVERVTEQILGSLRGRT